MGGLQMEGRKVSVVRKLDERTREIMAKTIDDAIRSLTIVDKIKHDDPRFQTLSSVAAVLRGATAIT